MLKGVSEPIWMKIKKKVTDLNLAVKYLYICSAPRQTTFSWTRLVSFIRIVNSNLGTGRGQGQVNLMATNLALSFSWPRH